MPAQLDFLLIRTSLRHFSVVVVLLLFLAGTQAARKEEEIFTASNCLEDLGQVKVQCKKANQRIKVTSVAYAHAPDCKVPSEDNDCTQLSKTLSQKTQSKCDGLNICLVPVLSIAQFNSEQQENFGLEAEDIPYTLDSCNVDKFLQSNVNMNLFQVKFSCEEFAFCNALSDEVSSLSMATPEWPEKVITNPTCECTFSSPEPQDLYLNGLAHCNGTVKFKTEETDMDGTISYLDYDCKNKFREDFITIGSTEPNKVKMWIDVENSDEDTAYEITWIAIKTHSKTRKPDVAIGVECAAGKLYLRPTTQLILKIVLPTVGCLAIILIIIYCVVTKRRRSAKDWRARHVRLPSRAKQASMGVELNSLTSGLQSRASSIDSFSTRKQERVDPEGNVDDLGEFAAMIHRQNEERRRKELEKRNGYKDTARQPAAPVVPSPSRTPPPVRSTSIQPNRRTQSIGNLRSDRRYRYGDATEVPPEPKPLSYSKSASQSRASVRSLKKRAPQPPGPPAPAVGTAPRPGRLHHTTSTPSVHRVRSVRNTNASQPFLYTTPQPTYYPLPSDNRSPTYATPYAASPASSVPYRSSQSNVSPYAASPSPHPSRDSEDDDDMPVMRPSNRPRPSVAPKPQLPPKKNPRYPQGPGKPMRSITPGEIGQLQSEIDNSD